MDEQHTADGLRRGSRDAWHELYDMYAEPLWREVSRLTGGRAADVADIVQDTFLSAARCARQYDAALGSLWMWLRGIARKRVALYWREQAVAEQARRWWASRNGLGKAWLAGSVDAPPEALQSKELATLVRKALSELPADYEFVLVRSHLDGASSAQIGAESGSTAEAVRARLVRAREAFRKAFLNVAGRSEAVCEGNKDHE